jgi:hypothetical protein
MSLDQVRQLSHGIVIVVLLAAGVQKLFALSTFRRGLLSIPHFRVWLSYVVGYGLPIVELGAALGLLLGVRGTALLAAALFLSFAGVAALVIARGLNVPCNCFGTDKDRFLSASTIVWNTVLLLLTAIGRPSADVRSGLVGLTVAAGLVLMVLLVGTARKNALQARTV